MAGTYEFLPFYYIYCIFSWLYQIKALFLQKKKVFAEIIRMNDFIIPFPQFRPEPDDVFYHYCSAESFKAIIENKTLRFCDLYHMNDKTELKHGYFLFKTLLKESDMPAEQQKLILSAFNDIKNRFMLLSMSFSKIPDQLSQWRGYADDGKGFCIGFKASELEDLPINILKAEYNIDNQCNLITNAINILKDNLDDKSYNIIAGLMELFALLKNESFSEEHEYRLVHSVFIDIDYEERIYDIWKLDKKYRDYIKDDISFSLVDNIPTPYVDLFFNIHNREPISNVIIGPKNNSEEIDVHLFLKSNNIKGVNVSKSTSSYR